MQNTEIRHPLPPFTAETAAQKVQMAEGKDTSPPLNKDGCKQTQWIIGTLLYYAIDVTNTNTRRPTVMWEFSDEDDADMGYSYGKAFIARIYSTGHWVALIPNGYNNSQKDYPSLPSDDPLTRIGDGSVGWSGTA